jgi:hypothetical protein
LVLAVSTDGASWSSEVAKLSLTTLILNFCTAAERLATAIVPAEYPISTQLRHVLDPLPTFADIKFAT